MKFYLIVIVFITTGNGDMEFAQFGPFGKAELCEAAKEQVLSEMRSVASAADNRRAGICVQAE